MKNKIRFKGEEYPLCCKNLKVGDLVEDFTVVNSHFKVVKMSDFGKRTRVISVFPSLDTVNGTIQNKRMNAEAHIMNKDIEFISISMDLPTAQTRFAIEHDIENVTFYSDYRFKDFGKKYGFLIEDLGLLSRGLIIIDANNVIKYVEYVEETSEQPNFNFAISTLKPLLK